MHFPIGRSFTKRTPGVIRAIFISYRKDLSVLMHDLLFVSFTSLVRCQCIQMGENRDFNHNRTRCDKSLCTISRLLSALTYIHLLYLHSRYKHGPIHLYTRTKLNSHMCEQTLFKPMPLVLFFLPIFAIAVYYIIPCMMKTTE